MRVIQVSAFPPRGGSAQVVRYLSKSLAGAGVEVGIVSGSLRDDPGMGDASRFFHDLPTVGVDYSLARRGFAEGHDPISVRFDQPISPSYEDRKAVADRVFYKVDSAGLQHLVNSWRRVLSETASSPPPDVLHLHHLNHLHLAAIGSEPFESTTKLAHLHGTEVKMLRNMQRLRGDPSLHTKLWEDALRAVAQSLDHLVANSEHTAQEARELLGVRPEALSVIPNGVDTDLFYPRRWSQSQRVHYLEDLLVRSPRGWDESGVEGSIRYGEEDLQRLSNERGELRPIAVYAGRFLSFKRVDLLLTSVAELNRLSLPPFNVLICGGSPGEWEGEHPYKLAMRLGLHNVYFAGWLGHDDLAQALALADLFVAPSSFEPFGQVYLEAMASSVPVVATRSGGPAAFVVEEGPTANGWLCAPDDKDSLVAALADALGAPAERRRRGANGLALVRRDYTWSTVARRFKDLYERLQEAPPRLA